MDASVTPSVSPTTKVYRPRVLGALGRVALGLTCFVLVGLLMRAVAAPAGGSVIGGKVEYWRDHGREYDTVFLGSSHVYRAFVPSEFDRTATSSGLPTRSFNFGVQAVHLLEQRFLMHEVLAAHPKLARVFFEYEWLTPQLDPQNAFNPRTVYWHDRETTELAVERALHWQKELGDGLAFVEPGSAHHSIFTALDRLLAPGERAAEEHVQHYLTDLLLIGRGKDVVRGLLGRESGQTARFRASDGYLSLEDEDRQLASQGEEHNSYRARRERFLADPAGFHGAIDHLDADPTAFGDADWVDAAVTRVDDFELIASIASEVRARGAEFVLVILPSQSCNRPFEERLMNELGSLVLRYNVPERYPELYDPANRWDSGHLSAEGAQYFSRRLAHDYVAQRGVPRDGTDRPAEVPHPAEEPQAEEPQ